MLFSTKDDNNKRLVDAIVFLFSGTDNIEDEQASEFVEMVVKGLTEEEKKRSFFVITKASKDDFRNNKDKIMQKARDYYSDSFGIPKERITYIDNILARFNKEVLDKVDFNTLPCPLNWDKNEWKNMTYLYQPIIDEIKEKRKEDVCNTSINKVISEWANFDHLKKLLINFLVEEKTAAYNNVCKKIEEDCLGFIKRLKKRKKIIEGGKEKIHNEKERLMKLKSDYDALWNKKIRREVSIDVIWPQFDFIDERIYKFSNIEDISLVRTAYLQLKEDVEKTEKKIIESIKQEFKEYISNSSYDSYASLEMIDLDELERKAKEVPQKTKAPEEPRKSLFGRLWNRLLKLFTSDKEIAKTYPSEKDNAKLICQGFTNLVINEARQRKIEFKAELESIVSMYCDLIGNEVNSRCQKAEIQLQELEGKLADKDNLIAEVEANLLVLEKQIQ